MAHFLTAVMVILVRRVVILGVHGVIDVVIFPPRWWCYVAVLRFLHHRPDLVIGLRPCRGHAQVVVHLFDPGRKVLVVPRVVQDAGDGDALGGVCIYFKKGRRDDQ